MAGLKKLVNITALNSAHPLFSKVARFIVFDNTIQCIKNGTVYTSTAQVVDDALLGVCRSFTANGNVVSPTVPVPFGATVLAIYRHTGSNTGGSTSDSVIFQLSSGDGFALAAGSWSAYDYRVSRRGNFGTSYNTDYKPYSGSVTEKQKLHATALDYFSGASTFYQNGSAVPVYAGTAAPTFTPSANPINVTIAPVVGTTGSFLLAGFVVFNTQLTDAEKASVTTDPWSMTNGTEPIEATVSSAIAPSSTVTATLLNYQTAPTSVVITDARGSTMTRPLTLVSGNNYSFTVPPLAAGDFSMLQFGAVSLTFGAKTIPSTLDLPTGKNSVTLVSPVDTYLFNGLTKVPAVGDQIVWNSADGDFTIGGDFITDVEGIYPFWIIYKDGTAFGDSLDFVTVPLPAVSNITLRSLTPTMKKGSAAPLGKTALAGRFGYRPPPPAPQPTGVFFTENFDAQPDYTSAQFKSNGAMPANVYAMRIADDLWTPSSGHPDREECLIIDNTRAYNNTGKSAKFHRMSNSNPTNNTAMWNSEDIMLWYFPEGMLQVYVEYMIRFDDNWTFGVDTGASKVFRIFSWNGQGNIFQFFEGGNSGPLFVWDKEETALYGTRNPLSMRGGPWGSNYYMSGADFGNVVPNSNFTNSLINQGKNGTTPQLPDKLNGGLIPNSGTASHAQVFGPAGTWTKMAFFVKMNSSPSVADGELKMWMDDKQIVNGNGIHWVKSPASGEPFIPKWNCIALGGNDYFHAYPTEDRRSEWYAVDNIVMRHDIPEGLS